MKPSFSIGSTLGISISVHYTWLFAFALISWSLAAGFYPHSYPGWTTQVYWATGVSSALLLFISVLVHELAHSLVARARGLPVDGITLFIFGGVSRLKGEAANPRDELIVTIVGPLASGLLAGGFWLIRMAVGAGSSPLAAGLTYLALINGLLAAFNLLPGFPLDGGRVLRSLLWGRTGNLTKATNVAATVGKGVGWSLIVLGVFQALQGTLLGGMWIAFIGWFLIGAADSSRREMAERDLFLDVTVREVMERDPETVEETITVLANAPKETDSQA